MKDTTWCSQPSIKSGVLVSPGNEARESHDAESTVQPWGYLGRKSTMRWRNDNTRATKSDGWDEIKSADTNSM